MAVAVILGSAYSTESPPLQLEPTAVETPWGETTIYRAVDIQRPAYVLFRHGTPYRYLPNQIPYRAHAWALGEVGCSTLLVTSSVGVLDRAVPLFEPLVIADILTLDNRLPDGSACTLFDVERPGQGHLVLAEGLISPALSGALEELITAAGETPIPDIVFGYSGGPRTKTRAENLMWQKLGAQVNSMSVAPELILAAERGIACATLAIGHKLSLGDREGLEDESTVRESLDRSRAFTDAIVERFLATAPLVTSGNFLYPAP